MRLVSFDNGFGRVHGDTVIPMGQDIIGYLGGDIPAREGPAVSTEALPLLAPVPCPGKIICIGLNYRDHALEVGQQSPAEPVLLAKYANSLVGPSEDIVVPQAASSAIDFEAELGVVIGRRASRVSAAFALDYVAGYMCVNDVSDRALQIRSSQWMRGKATDTFIPAGPWVTTVDEVPEPQSLWIRVPSMARAGSGRPRIR
jgi:acylpyruvate hydrolase